MGSLLSYQAFKHLLLHVIVYTPLKCLQSLY
nr:MAG TPA: hypothetical protein [Caudoviricetes sp.]DAK13990.1 MAG TPA: hypothetical protein [Caudoviricetes sp.]DAQ83054.1 MAG TPA: hypothetical protein [Caudoviricetes sp.]